MDENWRRQFGLAIRAADGIPDEDATLPAVRDPRTGQWDVACPPRSGNRTILMIAFATVAALVWFAA